MPIPGFNIGQLELGASTFAHSEPILESIIHGENLTQELISSRRLVESAIWNGSQIIATVSTTFSTWRDWMRMFKLYGLGFARSMYLLRAILHKLRRLSTTIPIRNIYQNMEQLGLEHSLWWTPKPYLRSKGVTGPFVMDYVSASLRASFGLSLFETNAYFLSLALGSLSEQQWHLKSGNGQLIDKMIARSEADLHYSRQVTEITTALNGSVILKSSSSPDDWGRLTQIAFDAVVIAAPWASTAIKMPELTILPSYVEYVGLYVTHFVSPCALNPKAFNLPSDANVPDDIISTPSSSSTLPFPSMPNNLTFLRLTRLDPYLSPTPPALASPSSLHLYRLLTSSPPSIDQLSTILLTRIPYKDPIILWYHTQHWPFAYPKADYEQSPYFSQIANNVYSTANMELVGSRLETAVTAGMNVAELVDREMKKRRCQGDLRVVEVDMEE